MMSGRGNPRVGLWLTLGAVGVMVAGAEISRRSSAGVVQGSGSRTRGLSVKQREALPPEDFALPERRAYPIQDLDQGRLAMVYAMSPSNSGDRYRVMLRVLQRYPELAAWWNRTRKGSAIPISKAHFDDVRQNLAVVINNPRASESARRQAEDEDAALASLIRLVPRLHARAA